MGLLRYLLAVAVLIAHSNSLFGFKFIGAVEAVQIFFILSGFYMTLVLNKKYIGAESYKLFISNRFLRLYPIYVTIFLITLGGSIGLGIISGNWGKLSPYLNYIDLYNIKTFLFLLFSNLFIFGQDLIMFMGIDSMSGSLTFSNNFRNTDPALYKFLFIPQAWSIGLELLFYLIAPFVVRKKLRWIFLFITLSLGIRIYISSELNWTHDPWTYRFFPSELMFFLLGTLSYHLYEKIKENKKILKYKYLIIGIYTVYLAIYEFLPKEVFIYKDWILYFSSLIVIPYLFIITKNNRFDNYIGELSYPIYLVHVLIIFILDKLYDDSLLTMIAIIVSTIFAILLVKYIDLPIEKIRQSRVLNQVQL